MVSQGAPGGPAGCVSAAAGSRVRLPGAPGRAPACRRPSRRGRDREGLRHDPAGEREGRAGCGTRGPGTGSEAPA